MRQPKKSTPRCFSIRVCLLTRRDGVTDFRTRREERAQTVEHQPFDVARRNAPAFGVLGATASDKRRQTTSFRSLTS